MRMWQVSVLTRSILAFVMHFCSPIHIGGCPAWIWYTIQHREDMRFLSNYTQIIVLLWM